MVSQLFFYNEGFGIRQPMKVDMSLNKENQETKKKKKKEDNYNTKNYRGIVEYFCLILTTMNTFI